MYDLTLAPPRDNSTMRSILIAVLVLAAAAAATFYFIPRNTAKLTVTNVQIFAPRTEFKPARGGGSMNIVGQDSATEDDLYVVATVHLEDKFRMPLSVESISGTLTLADGTSPLGSSVARRDMERLGSVFPTLAPMLPHPIGYGDDILPGKPLDGEVVLQFPGINADQWKNRKAANLTLGIHNQPAQTVPLP